MTAGFWPHWLRRVATGALPGPSPVTRLCQGGCGRERTLLYFPVAYRIDGQEHYSHICFGCQRPYADTDEPTQHLGTIQFVKTGPNALVPTRTHRGDAGFDLYVAEDTCVEPNSFRDVETQLKVALPDGYWGRIVGRSSTVRRRQLLVVEGIIDQGYRGPLFFGVQNLSSHSIPVQAGERLAQLILNRIITVDWQEVEYLERTDRGERGFGSTGL